LAASVVAWTAAVNVGRTEDKVTGVKVPLGVVGASAVLSSQVAKSTLPFTGIALGIYAAIGGGLVLMGLAVRLVASVQGNR
jgi:hypothetical protein